MTTARTRFYLDFEKSSLPIREKPVSRISFFCTFRTIDVFYRRHGLHFINLSALTQRDPRVVDLVSRHCRASECGIRSKNRGGVSRIRDFFRFARHQQKCGNQLKSKAGKLRIRGVSFTPGFLRDTLHCHV